MTTLDVTTRNLQYAVPGGLIGVGTKIDPRPEPACVRVYISLSIEMNFSLECKSKLEHKKQKNEKKKRVRVDFFPPHTDFHFGKNGHFRERSSISGSVSSRKSSEMNFFLTKTSRKWMHVRFFTSQKKFRKWMELRFFTTHTVSEKKNFVSLLIYFSEDDDSTSQKTSSK